MKGPTQRFTTCLWFDSQGEEAAREKAPHLVARRGADRDRADDVSVSTPAR